MLFGLLDLSLWGYIAVTLAMTHVSIVSVTVYLHRHQAHRALDLHPAASHFFRFWLWLTTGQETRQWSAIHRKHHARVETAEDPHSPQVLGLSKVLLEGAELYRVESRNRETMERYGHGSPDDWLERNIYTPHSGKGYFLLLAVNLLLFGVPGLTIWAVQMMWMPVFAAGVINGVGHYWGYRHFETPDNSTNIVPWGILIGGEELHNNHHAFASSAKLSSAPWEFDIGWMYICVLQFFGLAKVKKIAPQPLRVPEKAGVDLDTVRAVLANRMQVMAEYGRKVLKPVHAEEVRRADPSNRNVLKRAGRLLVREESLLNDVARQRLDAVLTESQALETAYQFKLRLQAIWHERTASYEALCQSLQDWCKQAEASGIRALQEFARTLPSYTVQGA